VGGNLTLGDVQETGSEEGWFSIFWLKDIHLLDRTYENHRNLCGIGLVLEPHNGGWLGGVQKVCRKRFDQKRNQPTRPIKKQSTINRGEKRH